MPSKKSLNVNERQNLNKNNTKEFNRNEYLASGAIGVLCASLILFAFYGNKDESNIDSKTSSENIIVDLPTVSFGQLPGDISSKYNTPNALSSNTLQLESEQEVFCGEIPSPLPMRMTKTNNQPTITIKYMTVKLRSANSPILQESDAIQYLFEQGMKLNINPAVPFYFGEHESGWGKKGVARITKSIGNLRQVDESGYPEYGGFQLYPSWKEGMSAYYRLINNYYLNFKHLDTLDKVIPVYAPAADNNNEGAYIDNVDKAIRDAQKEICEKIKL